MKDSKVFVLVVLLYVLLSVVVVGCFVTVLKGSSKESECKEPDTQYEEPDIQQYGRRYGYHV
jgi:flagellar basal body-associated protein FliL